MAGRNQFSVAPFQAAGGRLLIRVPCALQPGWQRFRIRITADEHPGIRKSLSVETEEGERLAETHWNRSLAEDFLLRIDHPLDGLRLVVRHARGRVHLRLFRAERVSSLGASLRAVRAKLALLRQFRCMGPVLKRGGRLLVRGDFQTFQRKLLKGLPDSRTMRLEAKRAEEAGGSWWRRRAFTAEQLQRLRLEAESDDDPVAIGVLLPADATRVDHARQAAFSVLRQVHPHWQLRILWPGDKPPAELSTAIRHDERASIVCAGDLTTAARRAIAELPCERIVLLSPDAELAEDALMRAARTQEDFRQQAIVGACSVEQLATCLPDEPAVFATALLRDCLQNLPERESEPLAFVLDSGGDSAIAGIHRPAATSTLHLAGNFSGISGWDAVAFQMLHGLAASGVSVLRHPAVAPGNHTLPPGIQFETAERRRSEPLLIVAPPYQVKRFEPDAATAVFTMWECDRLPAADAAVLNRAGLVIVPSRWVMECFRASGVRVPMELVPLGYDPQVFHPGGRKPQACTFGTAGALNAGGLRKNIGMVIDGFRAAFPDDPGVRLRIKLTPNCAGLDYPDDPRIEVRRAVLPPGDVAAWYRSLTTYVNASFAEGFGLHLLEAMACGVPLVSTRSSGPADYFDDSVGFVIPHRTVEARNEVYRGCWYEPEFAAIVSVMQRIRQLGTGETGDAAAARARRFTWRDSGRALLTALRKHGFLSRSLRAAA